MAPSKAMLDRLWLIAGQLDRCRAMMNNLHTRALESIREIDDQIRYVGEATNGKLSWSEYQTKAGCFKSAMNVGVSPYHGRVLANRWDDFLALTGQVAELQKQNWKKSIKREYKEALPDPPEVDPTPLRPTRPAPLHPPRPAPIFRYPSGSLPGKT